MIELKNVTIRAGNFHLNDVCTRIETAEYAVLMGRSGTGKTTVLESICGLRKIQNGSIWIHDNEVTNWLPGMRGVGYVPQDLALFPHMSVAEQLSFALKLRKIGRKQIRARVEELGEQLGIVNLLGRSIQGLSGGERQRVAIGRAVSFQPKILLLDEPFSALDEQTREEMHQLVKAITVQLGITTLHVTHLEQEAAALATKRLYLEDSQIIEMSG